MLLRQKRLLVKKAILISSLIGIIIFAIIGVIRHVQKEVDAITAEGASVYVYGPEPQIFYDGWGTFRYTATIGSKTYPAYCANPGKNALVGTFKATILSDTENNKKIKLILFASTVNNSVTQSVMEEFFPGYSSDKKYAFTHAVIGAIYANDYTGLYDSSKTRINNIITKLGNMIENQHDAWVMAENYTLYKTDRSGTSRAGSSYQDVVWIETEGYGYGSIKVQKKDSDTQSSTPQGGASLQGITFEVYNNSGSRIYNPKTGSIYDDGALVASGTTDANGEVTFPDLVLGKYLVKETATNSSYDLTSTSSQGVTLSTNGQTATLTFYDNVKKGSIEVLKKDAELDSCNKLGKGKFTGIKFQVINNSAKPIIYNGTSIAKGSVVAEKILGASDCKATFSDLPYGSYIVKELGSSTGYINDSTAQHNVTIPTSGSSTITVSFKNQVIRGDVKFKKVNQDGQAMANIPFRITSKTTGESHIVITNSNGVVNTSASVNLHSNHTNGYDSISNFDTATYQGYGTWFGKSASSSTTAPVNDSLGALPYDTYEIVEIACSQNEKCRDIETAKQTFEIKTNTTVVDLGNWENDCSEFSLSTTATDNADGDKYVIGSTQSKIKDTISYCLKAGETYTIKGTLMDKTTGQPIMVGGAVIEKTITLTPTTDCGETTMTFTIDTSVLVGHEIVVFEEAYLGNELIVSHEDINDTAQTVTIVALATTAADNADNDKYVISGTQSKIKDTISYCLKAGETYTIEGTLMDKTTGQPIMVGGNAVKETITITPTANCGKASMTFTVDTSALAGHEIVVFEKAYIGSTLIVSHENINDVAQTVTIVSLATTAVDGANGGKHIAAGSQSKIKDTIRYCLKAGETYTIEGTLMDKTTGQPILDASGKVIKKTIAIVPTANCGQETMTFTVDTSTLIGHEIVVFEKAYIGDTLVVSHEDINDVAQTVVVVSLDTTAVDMADDDKLISVDGHSEIKDTISYCLKAGETYTIKGTLMDKTTGEPIMIDGQVVEEIITFTPTTDCGEVTMVFTLDTSDLVGHEIVVFEKAYIGSTLIVSHEDIDDDAQTVIVIDLTTYATDDNSEVGSKEVAAKGIVRIKDVVRYCLKAGEEFTVKGILMNKDTGEVLLINGEPVVQTVTFTPETDCGEIDMFYEFDATGLGGVTVVIFENLYQGDKLLIEHNDLENADETFYLVTPPPNTGFITRTSDGGTEHNMTFMLIIPALAAVGAYGGLRIRARRKFLNRF